MKTLPLLCRLIRIPSVTADKTAVNRCSDVIAGILRKQGLYVRVEKAYGYKTVYAATGPFKKSDLLLNAHIDVVPGEKRQFSPVIKGGKLHGRGADDCKGHVVLIMNLLRRLKDKARVSAIFTSDEETGGRTSAYMAQKGYTGKFTLVLDGNFDRVLVAQKGILSLVLTAHGKACHSSAPWRGDNAIDRLIDGYHRVRKLFPPVSEKKSWRNTAAATMLNAGTVPNQVPDRAQMTMNIRFTGNTDPKALARRIQTVSGLSVKIAMISPFVSVAENHPAIQRLFRCLKATMNPAIRIGRMNGATDMRHFIRHGKAVAVLGLKGSGAHSSHEWLKISSLPRLEGALHAFIIAESAGALKR